MVDFSTEVTPLLFGQQLLAQIGAPTLAAAQAASYSIGQPYLVLQGCLTPGDGGGGFYIPAVAGAGPGKFQSADGQWWALVPNQATTVKSFSATGGGVTDDGAAIVAAVAGLSAVLFPSGSYKNASTAITFPFGKVVRFAASADIVSSGSGSATFNGITIREGYNLGGLTGWTGTAAYSYEGLSIDLGGYGPRAFGAAGTPSALNGSINIPASATIVNHASGVSGYAKSASTTTGGVALYGEANRTAANALVWGLNTRTQDGGFGGLNVWGYEMDMNIDNAGTTAIGFDAVGASSVEPTLSIAYQVQAIGIFASPKKRWQYAFRSRDAGAIVGLELGATAEGNNVGSQPIQLLFRNGSGTPTQGFSAQVDSSGNALLIGGTGATLFALRTPTSTSHNIQILGDQIGFYGATPFSKQTITGAKGGNTALASLLTALVNLGLITDSTT